MCGLCLSLLALATDAAAFDVVDLAASYIGRPYVWGAEGPRAFDCSGLTQHVFGEFGIDLPRRAVGQSQVGEPVDRRWQRGDLVFFRSDPNRPGPVTHVGIYEGGSRMINASKRHGSVVREDLNDPYWTQRFMFARHVSATAQNTRDGRIARRREDDGSVPRPSHPDLKRSTARAIGTVAEELLRRAIRRPRFSNGPLDPDR